MIRTARCPLCGVTYWCDLGHTCRGDAAAWLLAALIVSIVALLAGAAIWEVAR